MIPTISNDRETMDRLTVLMDDMRQHGLPTETMMRFFDVGEWLLCFERAWAVTRDEPAHPIAATDAYRSLLQYFADDLDECCGNCQRSAFHHRT